MSDATRNALLRDRALSPGSLIRVTFMKNFERTGFMVRDNRINEGRRTSIRKLLQKNAKSILKQIRRCFPPYYSTLKEIAPIKPRIFETLILTCESIVSSARYLFQVV